MGDEAVLVDVDDGPSPAALAAAVTAAGSPAVVEVVPAAVTVLIRTTPGADLADVARLVHECAGRADDVDPAGGAEELVVPVVYDGQDLADVAEHTGLAVPDVVAAHTGQLWTVAFCGFAPGFGYLAGLPGELHVPRRDTPRTAVEPGSVGIAGEFTGVYPRPSPGGWQLLGRTDLPVWDLGRQPPALLRPGVRVRFVDAGRTA